MQQKRIGKGKKHYAVVEGVGLESESIKQGCYTDSNNKLTVSNMGLFSDKKNTSSVDSYEFFGEITLVIDGREVETKQICLDNYSIPREYVRSRHALLKALTRPFLGFVINPKYEKDALYKLKGIFYRNHL